MMIKASFLTIFIVLNLQYFLILANPAKNGDKKNNRQKVIKDLYKVNGLEDLKTLGISVSEIPKTNAIMGRAGGVGVNKPAALISADVKDATPGKCDPKLECISNPLTVDLNSNQLPFPPCINIHRCGGCCPTNEKCVATRSHEVKLQKVGIITFDGNDNGKYDEKVVSVSNHTECQCQCTWETDNDCKKVNKNYVKSQYACECVCPEELSCDAFHEFDQESCLCKCRKDKFLRLEQTCKLKGFNWNDDYCRCEVPKLQMSQKEIKISNTLNGV